MLNLPMKLLILLFMSILCLIKKLLKFLLIVIIKISLNNVFKFIDSSKATITKNNFKFRSFNSQIFSKVIYFKVNLKLSNRDTALAMKDLYGINISHTTINTYCNMASSLVYSINCTKTDKISN